MTIIAIDPGPEYSAYLIYDEGVIEMASMESGLRNEEIEHRLAMLWPPSTVFAYEWICSYGMAVGQSVFDTCRWCGRFEGIWRSGEYLKRYIGGPHNVRLPIPVLRKEIKSHLCGNTRADNRFVREALIDRWGGKEKALGTKKVPGPLYTITSHLWAALAVAVYVSDVILASIQVSNDHSKEVMRQPESSIIPISDRRAGGGDK